MTKRMFRKLFPLVVLFVSLFAPVSVEAQSFTKTPEWSPAGAGKVQITITINSISSDIQIIIYDSRNNSLIGYPPANVTSKPIVTRDSGNRYTVSIQDHTSGREIARVDAIEAGTVVLSNTNCYKFKGTLFGDDICADTFLLRFFYWAVAVAIVGSGIMIIYAGYKYVLSHGDPGQIKDAKEIILNVLVGLALLLLSYTILRFIGVPVTDVVP